MSMELYPNQQFGFIDDTDRQSGSGSVPTHTWTRSDGPDPLLTLGALNGRVLWQLQRLFIIKHLNDDGAFVENWVALALTTIPENWGTLDPVSKFVQVRTAAAAVALEVFSMGNIVGCAHVIPEMATSSKTGDGPNER
jgi:hypothetical protein